MKAIVVTDQAAGTAGMKLAERPASGSDMARRESRWDSECSASRTTVLHVAGGVVPCDPSGTRAIAIEWTTAFPDWRFDLQALIAKGDRIVARMPYSGTHHQEIVGIPATNRSCVVDEIVIFRIESGRIAEAWEVYDEAGMWRQLGVTPPMLA